MSPQRDLVLEDFQLCSKFQVPNRGLNGRVPSVPSVDGRFDGFRSADSIVGKLFTGLQPWKIKILFEAQTVSLSSGRLNWFEKLGKLLEPGSDLYAVPEDTSIKCLHETRRNPSNGRERVTRRRVNPSGTRHVEVQRSSPGRKSPVTSVPAVNPSKTVTGLKP
ncbi:hypothetical protein B0H17DRAFT_1135889 [Mycena rosella]|uniref:Uncharacterized protein n=1 Tax=Mycena rosella TaxID=1033263 RepID=A0AAD7DC70_MYCRO|nr:hypothetical protein B0H17DRAFT_1135889 [Mycena rosella]